MPRSKSSGGGRHWYVCFRCICRSPRSHHTWFSWCGVSFGPWCHRAGHLKLCPVCSNLLVRKNICLSCSSEQDTAARRTRIADEVNSQKKQQEDADERQRLKEEKARKAKEAERQKGKENQRRIKNELRGRTRRTKEKRRKTTKRKEKVVGQPKVSKLPRARRLIPVREGVRKSARLQMLRREGRCMF